jgi:hypothetical protein
VAVILARAGDPTGAEAVIQTIESPHVHVSALTSLAVSLARQRDVAGARRRTTVAEAAARTLSDIHLRISALTEVAAAWCQTGDQPRGNRLTEEATALARAITNSTDKGKALICMAVILARAGNIVHARRLAEEADSILSSRGTLNELPRRGRVMGGLAADLSAALGEVGRTSRAQAIARNITDPSLRESALLKLMPFLARDGKLDQVVAITRSMTSGFRRSCALTELAVYLTSTGDISRAKRLLASALIMGTGPIWWAEKIPEIFNADLSAALQVLVDAYAAPAAEMEA